MDLLISFPANLSLKQASTRATVQKMRTQQQKSEHEMTDPQYLIVNNYHTEDAGDTATLDVLSFKEVTNDIGRQVFGFSVLRESVTDSGVR
ncbi:unnamed protein product [Dovyalis caffra]|uniref:Uncharacterized protein n=1 Tax=Dovyalis caffra TaxID=77055 RepID=A0AAV1SCA2_9ROSI|nr:unnamed protein product [Dovyalis caffra]